ncbi:MAG: energy-coupling factor transporter ATPase [Clostridia bacterium]|nr:energy-coupling factor transporter ATPase [Clostridia bacterium]
MSVENVSFSYDVDEKERRYVLKDVSFSADKGEYIAIVGRNGSGKSTLAKLLNLILSPDKGRIYVGGTDITDENITLEDILKVRRTVGMVFQNPDNQLVATIVEEDIAFGPENLGIPSEEIRERVSRALAAVGMTEYARHSPTKLSGGQKQRIAIAGILAMLPQCIIFDESTAMLDPSGRREVMDIIEDLNRNRGITVIMITHNMDEAVRADRVVIIDDGRIVRDGRSREIFADAEYLRKTGLDVPQVTELFYRLRKDGIALPGNILNEREGAEILFDMIGKSGK